MTYKMPPIKISPSDLTFLPDCPRCFQRKIREGIRQPSIPLPTVFGQIHNAAKNFFDGQSTAAAGCELPEGTFRHGEQWIESSPIDLPGCELAIYFRGRIDMAVEFDDGSFGLVDFKTIRANAAHEQRYAPQLHAYALSLERPAPGKLELNPISMMGLICFEHGPMEDASNGGFAFTAKQEYIPIRRDDAAFLDRTSSLIQMAFSDKDAPQNPECSWCQYLRTAR